MSEGQPAFWDVQDRLREPSAQGDPLEKLAATVDFEIFRAAREAALGPRDRAKGGREAFDPVRKLTALRALPAARMLVLQAMHGLSLAQTEYLVADRLSWMRLCGFGPGDAVPDANTLWDFREALIAAGAPEALFARLDAAITAAGHLPMAGQIVDATLVAAPRQRNTEAEKARIKARERARDIWPDQLARAPEGHGRALDGEVQPGGTQPRRHAAAGAEGNARRAVRRRPGLRLQVTPGRPSVPHMSIDRRHGVIRRGRTTDAAAHDGARLREGLIDPNNTASVVWGDAAYRLTENERYLRGIGKVSRIHRRKPPGRPMPSHTARSNAAKSAVRAHVEHPFAHRKGIMGLVIRTIGIARARATVTLANMAYNMKRWCWLEGRRVAA